MLSPDPCDRGSNISLWKHISRINWGTLNRPFKWLCDFIRPCIGALSYMGIGTSVAWLRQGQVDRIDWQWRQALPSSSISDSTWRDRACLGLVYHVDETHFTSPGPVSATSKVDCPYTKAHSSSTDVCSKQVWGTVQCCHGNILGRVDIL